MLDIVEITIFSVLVGLIVLFMQWIRSDIKGIRGEMGTMRGEMSEMKQIQALQGQTLHAIQETLGEHGRRLASIDGKLANHGERIARLEGAVSAQI